MYFANVLYEYKFIYIEHFRKKARGLTMYKTRFAYLKNKFLKNHEPIR